MSVGHAAAELVDQLAHRQAGGRQLHAGVLDPARYRVAAKTMAAVAAVRTPPGRPLLHDVAHPEQRFDVVDQRRQTEQPDVEGRWGLVARQAAFALAAFPQRRLRAAYIGAGAYICGEESALLESIEGKRGLPRHKPPYPFQVGLFGLPTLINNIETLWWVRDIVEKGAGWWQGQGRNERHGLRSYSVSGRVKNPGMKLAPAGVTVRELIDEFCGGMADGHTFKAYLPGGASGGILPASMDNIPLDFGTLEKYGCFIGSAAVVILSDKDQVKEAALNLMRFFEDESCGQCTPCRVGTQKAATLMEQRVWNRDLLDELSQAMRDASICGLGQAASNPLTTVIKYFPNEFAPKEAAE